MTRDFDVLAELTFEAWLLARAADSFESLVDGRIWERTVGDFLRRPRFLHRQGPGEGTLFGRFPASGVRHELDACAADWEGNMILLECKSQRRGVTKAEAALFHEKTLDFYCARPHSNGQERWWRLIVSSVPISDDAVRAFCIQLGLILCDPERPPLPMILEIASRPNADMYLREMPLQEIVRMGELALQPMQDRWVYDSVARNIRFRPQVLRNAGEIRDLLYLQDTLGQDIFDLYESHRPDILEREMTRMKDNLIKATQPEVSFVHE